MISDKEKYAYREIQSATLNAAISYLMKKLEDIKSEEHRAGFGYAIDCVATMEFSDIDDNV